MCGHATVDVALVCHEASCRVAIRILLLIGHLLDSTLLTSTQLRLADAHVGAISGSPQHLLLGMHLQPVIDAFALASGTFVQL